MGYRVKTMLSRHASSLYWLGRYQERAEYLARHLQVKYFSTIDSMMTDYRDLTLRSILFMSSGVAPENRSYDEGDILWEVAINMDSQTSILKYLKEVRENTKGVRNLISNELWETVNKNFHFANNFNSEYLKSRGLYEFTHGVQENSASFHAKLESTLLHDNVWAFIKLGIEIERIYQVIRSLNNTLIDINAVAGANESETMENYQWLTTLQTLEAVDMTRKIFNTSVKRDNTCEFLISNKEFPRSILFCFEQVKSIVLKIKNAPLDISHRPKSLEYKIAKISSELQYLEYDQMDVSLGDFLSNMMKKVIVINDLIHEDFFDYK